MNLVITKIEYPYVSFTSNNGEGLAYTSDQQLDIDRTYSVEFDILSNLNTNDNTKIGTNKPAGFYDEDGNTLIVALVESIDEYGDSLCLRIAIDCIIEAYRSGDSIDVGDRLEIRMPKDKFKVTIIGC
ncbi:hypothetical protein [Chitinophaga sancti]|uniref:Uncharacterized protein n=1 Tax=Chitinophaga sancti TaxID=1004 RepID=A0A1K1SBY3_9BACT|nr:hypothetical protein [Chitinophaga sancti]WQD63573.1 hypothetical protein U0033_04135 [Chitinophaga sancti]WQG90801.1 hypothetical protein SR876_04780 [Chitinophaga sancti]SFW81806.1 hypothetical protein SAMN05661012_05145 [Chitinophaga sancti]